MAKTTTIVAIFDNTRDLDEAVERLAEAGIEETVFDEVIVAEEAGMLSPCQRHVASRPGHGHGVPELRPLSAHDSAG
jgi:hypothetical protein